jgi:AraC-like DNA-binding protein
MSRSSFAQKFKETVGASPMDYLTRWRMLLAGDRLENSSDPVSAIARSLGYQSESAFSTAFKRVMGCAPRQYGRGGKAAAPGGGEGERARGPIGLKRSRGDGRGRRRLRAIAHHSVDRKVYAMCIISP